MSFEDWQKENEELSGFEGWQQENVALLEEPKEEPLEPNEAYERAGEVWDLSTEYELPRLTIEELFMEPPKNSLAVRGAKRFANQLILSDIERGRPSTAIAHEIFGLGTALEAAAEIKSPEQFEKLSLLGKIKVLPKMMLAARKGYYSPEAREITTVVDQALRDYRGAVDFDIAPPEKTGEKIIDVGTGLGAFITRVALTKKILPASMNKYPNLQRALSFEMANTDGKPGEGAAMAAVIGLPGSMPAITTAQKAFRLSMQSSMLAGYTKLKGGSNEDVVISALIPIAFAVMGGAKGKISDYKIVKTWRQQLPFSRDIPLNQSMKMAKSMRAMYEIKGMPEFREAVRLSAKTRLTPKESVRLGQLQIRMDKMISLWNKVHGKNYAEFSKLAYKHWESYGPEPIAQISGEVTKPTEIAKKPPAVEKVGVKPKVPPKAPEKPLTHPLAQGKTHQELADMPIKEYGNTIHNPAFQRLQAIKKQQEILRKYGGENYAQSEKWKQLKEEENQLFQVTRASEMPDVGQQFHVEMAEAKPPKLAEAKPAAEGKVEELNFTQFATQHGYPSDYDITDHSMLSPSGKVSKRAKSQAMKRLGERIAKNKQAHREFEEAILAGEIIDPSGEVTKEGLLARRQAKETKKIEGRLAQIDAQIRMLKAVGKGKRGIKPSYQKQIDDLEAERKQLAKPEIAEKPKEPWEMTSREYAAPQLQMLGTKGITETRLAAHKHKKLVQEALSEGKPVPREVLEEYKSEKWGQEALKEKPAIEKKFYTSVPEEWRQHKVLSDWGVKGLRTKGNLKVGKRKSFIWTSEFDKIPTRLPKTTMDAFRAKTDEIWYVTNRKKGVENYYLVPKQVVVEVRKALGETAFERRSKPVPTPRQVLTYAIQSANVRGNIHPGEVIERALADKEVGITEAELTDNQKRILEEYRRDYEQDRQEVLRDIQERVEEKVFVAEEEVEERIAIQEEELAGEVGDFLDGIVEQVVEKPKPAEKPRPKDLLGRPVLKSGAVGKQLDFDLKIYIDKVPPTDIPTKVALQDAVAQALNKDYQKVRATKKKYKGVKDEKTLYEREFMDKSELFLNPENPLPEMRAAWTIATKGKGLFGGKTTSEVIKDTKKPIDHRQAGFIQIPPITTAGQIEAEHPNIKIVTPKKDIGILQKTILTLTNQAQNTGHPVIIEAANTMADTGMVMWNETRSQLTADQHIYKQLPKEYRANKGEKFFALMDKHYSPEEIDVAKDIPDEVKPVLKHFKLQDEAMRQEIIKQKRQMMKAVLMRKKKADLQLEAENAGIELQYQTLDKEGEEVLKDKTKAMLAAELVETEEYVPDDWGREWSHIQHIFFGQYELQWQEVDIETGKMVPHFIGRAQTQTEAYEKLADWKVAREAAGFDDADKVQLIATPELHIPFDVLRISRKHFYTLEKQIQEAADMQRQEIDDALRGVIGKRESKQKWWGALMHRKGAPGYSQDFWKVWAVQTSQFNRWKHLSAMNRKVSPLIDKIRNEGLRGWAEQLEHKKDVMWGRKRSDTGRMVDEFLSHIPVVQNYVRPFALERWAGAIKTFNYWRHLQTGRFYVINSLQTLQTLWPVVGEKGLYRGIQLYYSKEGQALLRKYKVAGISGKLHELGMKRARKFERYLPAGASEIRNQGVAFLALYDDAIKRGMSEAEAAHYARLRGQLFTQFCYTPSDIPRAMEGPIGGLILQYKRFTIKNLELISRLAREGRWGGAARWVAAITAIGGLNVFLKAIPIGGIGYLTYKLYKEIRDKYGKEVADVVHHGLPGLVGIDLSGSVTPIDVPYGDNIYEKTGNIVFGPTGTTVVKMISDIRELKTTKEIGLIPRGWKSFVDASPTLKQFSNLIKAFEKDTTNFDAKQRALYELEVWDLWKKAFGFRPETESLQRMQFEAMFGLNKEYNETIDYIVLALSENDFTEAVRLGQNWQANFPEAPISGESIIRRIKERSLARQLPITVRGFKDLPKPLRKVFAGEKKTISK